MNDAVRASGRPWSTRLGPRRAGVDDLWSCTLRWDIQTLKQKEDAHTRDCEGCDVARSRSNREHQGPREAQRNKVIEEESIRRSARSAPRIWTPRTRPERDAKKAKEEFIKNIAESMHKKNQHEQVLRSEEQ